MTSAKVHFLQQYRTKTAKKFRKSRKSQTKLRFSNHVNMICFRFLTHFLICLLLCDSSQHLKIKILEFPLTYSPPDTVQYMYGTDTMRILARTLMRGSAPLRQSGRNSHARSLWSSIARSTMRFTTHDARGTARKCLLERERAHRCSMNQQKGHTVLIQL